MSAASGRPTISIVTPSFNQAMFLGEALDSVREQGYAEYEHLVLDGGSTDGSTSVLEGADGDSRLHWRSCPDGGQSAALNEGFGKANGEIVGWLNADDRYRAGCFARVAKAFADDPEIDVLYGDYTFMDESGRHLEVRSEIEFSRFVLRYCHTLYIPTTATFFRRRVFEEGNFLNEELHYAMDLEFFLRLADRGYRFQHVRGLLADFRVHSASKSGLFVDRQRAEHRRVVLGCTPLAHRFRSARVRNLAATLLQIPADGMRYAEKLMRGCYFSSQEDGAAVCEAERR